MFKCMTWSGSPASTASAACLQLSQRALGAMAGDRGPMSCNVYISEGQNAAVLERLEATARSAAGQQAALAHVFVDQPYHRSNFTLVSACPDSLAAAVLSLAQAALQLVDLRQHAATHPRLGAVDHISCHPLGPATHMPAAAQAARSIAQQLGEKLALPTYTYGHAHPQRRRLDDIRRQLGYFAGSASSHWHGAIVGQGQEQVQQQQGDLRQLPVAPCFGPTAAAPAAGVCCVGAVPLITNYNVLLRTDDLAAARQIARAVSERGGGLPAVQAMALQHAEGIEVACNLLDSEQSPPAAVLARVQALAAARGIAVGPGYVTGKSGEQLLQAWRQLTA